MTTEPLSAQALQMRAFVQMQKSVALLAPLTEHEQEIFFDACVMKQVKKNDFFVSIGEVCNDISFILQGCVRYYSLKDGEEITTDFLFENSFCTSMRSLISRKPSQLAIEAVEDLELLVITNERLQRLYEQNAGIERLGRRATEHTFLELEAHLNSLLRDPAEARYKNLLARSPSVAERIPLKHLASYLGVTGRHLSRIRKIIR